MKFPGCVTFIRRKLCWQRFAHDHNFDSSEVLQDRDINVDDSTSLSDNEESDVNVTEASNLMIRFPTLSNVPFLKSNVQ